MSSSKYSQLRFLVVDDFENFRCGLKKMLVDLGARHIDMAMNAKVALQYCEQCSYDVLLIDYNLGKGKNGQQLLEQLRAEKTLAHKAIVIMCTAEIEQEVVLTAAENQADSYLAKPFTFMLLKSRLQKLSVRARVLSPLFAAQDAQNYDLILACCDLQITQGSRYSAWCKKVKAEVLIKRQDLLAAEAIYREALEYKTSDWALLGLGEVFFANQQYDKALESYLEAIEHNPMHLAAYDKAAQVMVLQGDYQAAQATLEQAVSFSSRSIARVSLLAELAQGNGGFELALKCYQRAYVLAPNSIHHDAQLGLSLARCMIEHGLHKDSSDAKKNANSVLRLLREVNKTFDQPKARVLSLLIESCAHHSLSDSLQAQSCLKDAQALSTELGDDSDIDLELARSLVHLGNTQSALTLLNSLCQKHCNDAQLLRKLDRVTDKPISDLGNQNLHKLSKMAVTAYQKHEYVQAINIYDDLSKQYPRHVGVRLNLAQAYLGGFSQHQDHTEYLQGCEDSLNAVKYLAPDHENSRRFILMLRKFQSINSRASRHG